MVIIGEAPGGQEIIKQQAFIGPSGELLARTMRRYGLEPADAYITNALICRPKDAPPKPSSINACRARLTDELAAHPRDVILALGNSALRSLTGDHKLMITKSRGKAIEHELGLIVPTFHPAAILRNVNDFPRFARDLAYAAKLLNGGQQKSAGALTHRVLESPADFAALAKLRGKLLACDIETTGLSPRSDRILSLGIAYGTNKAVVISDRDVCRPEVKQLFEDPDTTFIWHNGKYDASFLQQAGIAARVDEDTMLMHYSLDETKATHDLGQLATELLGAPDYKGEFRRKLGKKGWSAVEERLAEEPQLWDDLHRYNALDCDSTLQVFRKLHAEISAPKNAPSMLLYREHLLPASDFLQIVERRGMWIDQVHLDALRELFMARLLDAEQRLQEAIKPVWDPELYFAETTKVPHPKKVPTVFVPGNSDHVLWLANKILPLHVPDARELTLRNSAQGIADTAAAAGSVGASRMKKEDLAETWTGSSKAELESERRKLLGGKTTNTMTLTPTSPMANTADHRGGTGLTGITGGIAKGRNTRSAASKQDIRDAGLSSENWSLGAKDGQVQDRAVGRAFLGRDQGPGRPDIGPAILQALFDYREAKKALGTWINGIARRIEDDGRVHSTFKLHGTETGRLSSVDPNFQNIPVKKKNDKPEEVVRNVFRAMPGCVYIELDYSQAELRLLAHLSDDDWLTSIYQTDRDLHTEVAIALYGPGYSYQQRMRAKAVNFGIAYGRSAYSLMGEFGIPQREAQRMVDEWFERAPGVRIFLDYCRTWVRKGETDPTPFGRRRRFPLLTGDTLKDLGNEAANFPMQSTASDLTLLAAMEIEYWLADSGLQAKAEARGLACGVVNLVHDAILIEVPVEWRDRIAAHAQRIMMDVPQRVLQGRVPFTADWHSAEAWADCK